MSLILPLLFFACSPKDGEDSGSPVVPGSDAAILATVSADYAVGALAAVDLESLAAHDNLTAVSGDPTVGVTGGQVVQMNRGADNNVRLYDPGAFSAPRVEFSTGDGSNPHDAEICGDALFVSLYKENFLAVYDPASGTLLEQIDLSAYDDGDGLPEASTMVVLGDTLYLALEQLEESGAHWQPAGGTVLAIDCERREILQGWETGPSPALFADPSQPDTLLLRTGVYYDAAGDFAWDGGLWRLDPASGETTDLGLDEAALEINLGAVAASASGVAVVLSTDSEWAFSLSCLDLATGTLTLGETVQSYLAAVAIDETGRAWVASRSSWAAPEAPGGVLLYDVESCTRLAEGDGISLGLEPYALAFY